MIKSSVRSRNFATHSLFGAFVLTVFGWGLLQAWCLQVRAGVLLHLVVALPGLVQCGIILYRYHQHWPIAPKHASDQQPNVRNHAWGRALAPYLLLIAVGAVAALFVMAESFFLVMLAALGLVMVPWARISICVHHFFLSSLSLLIGAALPVFVRGSLHPLYHLLTAWALLAVACIALLSALLTHGSRRDRMPVSGYAAPTTTPVDSTIA